MKLRLLVTGASGFVGNHFVSQYKNQYEILTIDLRKTKPEDIDFTNIDCVLHLAACVHQMKKIAAENYFLINTYLTESLAKQAKNNSVKHFIFMSTAHVYGDVGSFNHKTNYTEDSACHPYEPYAQSKHKAEQALQNMSDDKFKISIIRPPMVYGPNAKGNLVTLAKLVATIPILPFRYFENKRSIIFVGNLTYFIHLVAQQGKSGIFLPQDEKPLSIGEIIENLAAAQDKKIHLFRLPIFLMSLLTRIKPKIMTRLYGTLWLNSTNSNNSLGYKAIYTSYEGFCQMLSPNINQLEHLTK